MQRLRRHGTRASNFVMCRKISRIALEIVITKHRLEFNKLELSRLSLDMAKKAEAKRPGPAKSPAAVNCPGLRFRSASSIQHTSTGL